MTHTHDTAVAIEIYPDEFKPILKLLNLALMCKEVTDYMTQAEVHMIYAFKDDFSDTALEFAE